MLPQIRGNLFLTAELSAMFTKKEDDLAEIIGTIVRIADGQGLSTHSGAHGGRQEGDAMFTWAALQLIFRTKSIKCCQSLDQNGITTDCPSKIKQRRIC